MTNIRPTDDNPTSPFLERALSETALARTTIAQTGPGIPDEARFPDTLGPHEDPDFERELARAERRLRWSREHPLFGVHPDGLGPTLGQDLSRPNPGHDVAWTEADWDRDHYDPPT